MRVDNEHDAATLLLNLAIHLIYLRLSKILGIENEVFVAGWVVVLVCPGDVRPEYIDREAVIREFPVSVHEDFSRDRGPLTEMEAKGMKWGEVREARDCSQVFVDLLYAVLTLVCRNSRRKHEQFDNVRF